MHIDHTVTDWGISHKENNRETCSIFAELGIRHNCLYNGQGFKAKIRLVNFILTPRGWQFSFFAFP